jgi:hypothetical protein
MIVWHVECIWKETDIHICIYKVLFEIPEGNRQVGRPRLRWERNIGGCNQNIPDWPPGARTPNGTALCHSVQLCRYFVSQSSQFHRHNPLYCFSASVYCCKLIFRYQVGPETFGYTLAKDYIKEIRFEVVDLIEMARHTVQWRTCEHGNKTFGSTKGEGFLTSWVTVSFSRNILPRGLVR